MVSVDVQHHVYFLKKGLWRWKATEPPMTLWLIISGCGSAVRPVASGAAANWQVDRTWPLPPGAATWLDQHHLPQVSTVSGNLLLWTLSGLEMRFSTRVTWCQTVLSLRTPPASVTVVRCIGQGFRGFHTVVEPTHTHARACVQTHVQTCAHMHAHTHT